MPTPAETGYTWTDVAAWWGAIVATVVLIWNAIAWWATERNTQARHDEVNREARMDVVFKNYMKFLQRRSLNGVKGLFHAGVATLKSHHEIIELADRIVSHGKRDPLEWNNGLLRNVDLKEFFDFAAKKKPSLSDYFLQEAIERSGAKKMK